MTDTTFTRKELELIIAALTFQLEELRIFGIGFKDKIPIEIASTREDIINLLLKIELREGNHK